jgi:hypothetical protein
LEIMYVRVKEIGPRRYVYLVEGVRKGGRVSQKSLCYLGPIARLASGIPDETKKKVERQLQVDWKRVTESIRRIPLTFDELSEARRAQYATSMLTRSRGLRTQGNRPRIEGELSALSKLASTRFREMFEEIGERKYRMR